MRCLKAVAIIGLLAGLGGPAPGHTAAAPTEPPLITATKAGDSARVARLLDAGARVDAIDAAWNTALIFAAWDGRAGIARRLLSAGASVDWQDAELVTPLIIASFKNRPVLVRLLLAAGADPKIRDQWGRTALDYALRRGKADAIAAMIRAARP